MDRFTLVVNFAQAVLVAVVASFATAWLTYKTNDRAQDLEILKLAAGVLQAPVETSGGPDMRRWAWETVKVFSGVTPPNDSESPVHQQVIIGTTLQQPSATLPDIDVFVCSDSTEDQTEALSLATVLQPSFGGIRIKQWHADDELPASVLTAHTTIVYDDRHDEKAYVGQISDIAARVAGLPPVQSLPNRGKLSPWYFSVIVCN